MNSGTWMVTPLLSRAGLVLAVLVAVFMTGAVSTTSSSVTAGSSMAMGRPLSHSAWKVIPGSSLVGYINADHWAIAVPVARSHSTVGSLFVTQNAYPREALVEALLRFVEEDLAARGK